MNSALSSLLRQHTDCDTGAPVVSELSTVSFIEKSNLQTLLFLAKVFTHTLVEVSYKNPPLKCR